MRFLVIGSSLLPNRYGNATVTWLTPQVHARDYNKVVIIGPEELVAARTEVDRVLGSDLFRNSDSLRHLLAYLGEKSLADQPVELKEYTIGIEACGKSSAYDPQRDASVRVQVGRLRQKLEEYYHTEGVADPVIIELPKGRFVSCPKCGKSNPCPTDRSCISAGRHGEGCATLAGVRLR